MIVVRLPIAEVASFVAERNGIGVPLADFKIEAECLVLSFANTAKDLASQADAIHAAQEAAENLEPRTTARKDMGKHKRPGKRKRHRMKTRGWPVVTTITNSYGQRACIYKPFVEALTQKGLTPAQKRAIVAKILRSNGNHPPDASVEYYLMNTLEYLDQTAKQGIDKQGQAGAPVSGG